MPCEAPRPSAAPMAPERAHCAGPEMGGGTPVRGADRKEGGEMKERPILFNGLMIRVICEWSLI